MSNQLSPVISDPLPQDRLVMKDNALIMASYTLSVEEQRLILISIEKAQRIKNRDKNALVEVSISAHDYADMCNLSIKAAYNALSISSERLFERDLRLDGDDVKRRIRWLQERAQYVSGRIKIVFSSEVSKHIFDITNAHNAMRLRQATQLKSQHSIRLFEIFNMAVDNDTQSGIWIVNIDKLKQVLKLQDQYSKWTDLKRKVIEPALKLINTNTSLKVDWSIHEKNGRQVESVKFEIFESEQLNLPNI